MSQTTPWLNATDRLCFLGDSLTHAADGFVRTIKDKLSGQGISVINAGNGGDNVLTAMMRLKKDVIEQKPTAVSILFGANDAQVGRGIWNKDPMIPPAVFQSGLIWIIHVCRSAGIEKFSITPPLWRLEGEIWSDMGDVYAPYIQAARDASAIMNTQLVPADVAFAQHWARHPAHEGLLLTRDGCHLNEKGNQLVAECSLKTWGLAEGV
jgi:lysophospholipase L1-like esterase